MTRRLAVSQHQITAICKGAAKAGFVAEIEVTGVKVLLRPATEDELRKSDVAEDDIRL
ncbi:hypothetical protein [Nitratireductor thuwali]|uniref:hypothetical protein n=1 Tax=Nitratireductor thuwali TaxID=2267699 RepID=UPI0030D1AF98